MDDSDTDEQHIYAEIIDKTDCLTYPVEKSIKEEWPHVYEQTVEPDTQQGIPAPTDEVRFFSHPINHFLSLTNPFNVRNRDSILGYIIDFLL